MNIAVKSAAPYEIVDEPGALDKLGSLVKQVCPSAAKIAVVTDSNVAELYLQKAVGSLEGAGFSTAEFVFSAGERSKNAETYLKTVDALARAGMTRTDAVVALGGGVTGDLAGFAAATYMRGIDVVQAPTTLLAAIDSSIGGKTGVDLPAGKNLLGAFHQPRLVVFDSLTLETLPKDERKNGLGEGVKYAVLEGGRIFDILRAGLTDSDVSEFVALCQIAKAKIVAEDEKESGRRRLLNLGHTLGHAAEKLSGYAVPHGAAVAYGVSLMARAALAAGELPRGDYEKICSLWDMCGFACDYGFSYEDMFACAAADKKKSGGDISFVKIRGIGVCEIAKMPYEEFCAYVRRGEKI